MLTMADMKASSLIELDMGKVENAISQAMMAGSGSIRFKLTAELTAQDEKHLHLAGADRLRSAGYTVTYNLIDDFTVSGWF